MKTSRLTNAALLSPATQNSDISILPMTCTTLMPTCKLPLYRLYSRSSEFFHCRLSLNENLAEFSDYEIEMTVTCLQETQKCYMVKHMQRLKIIKSLVCTMQIA